jgi:low affinity Fe/Cu permease
MFVPWARSVGSIVGTLCAIAVAVAVAFFGLFGLSFLWIMPCALGVGIAVACLVSLIPTGRRASREALGGAIGGEMVAATPELSSAGRA